MPNLNSVQQAVKDIVEYSWDKESSDYAKQLSRGEETRNHIFLSLMKVSNVLNGTNTDPEMWAFETFQHFFEAMNEGDFCLKCREGTFNLVKATSLYSDHLKCSNCEMLAILGKEGH